MAPWVLLGPVAMNIRTIGAPLLFALLAHAASLGCSENVPATDGASSEVRSLTRQEALDDFDQLVASFRGLYAPLERKEARYGFSFEELVTEYRARIVLSTTDPERIGIVQEFVAHFKDAHVWFDVPLASDDAQAHALPFSVMPVENTYVVTVVQDGAAAQVKVGDELVSLDGVPAKDVAARYERFISVPNELTLRHNTAGRITMRSSYMSAGLEAGTPAIARFRSSDGTERDEILAWEAPQMPRLPSVPVPVAGSASPRPMGYSATAHEMTRAEAASRDERIPFFMTDAVKAAMAFEPVAPSPAGLADAGVSEEMAAQIGYFAGTYRVDGKRVLFVRLPNYTPVDETAAFAYLRVLFREQQPSMDGLIFDQTHNPGGRIDFASNVASLLARQRFNNLVTRPNTDRMWTTALSRWATEWPLDSNGQMSPGAALLLEHAHSIDAASEAHAPLAPFMTFGAWDTTVLPVAEHWAKPAVFLIDELDVSCGDMVPAMVKESGMATLFGQRTMGAGGNVEEVATLTNSRWTLSMTRSLTTVFDPTGAYPEASMIEDNGVTPDVVYSHTLADVRAGYVGYVNSFNAVLASKMH